MSPAKDGRAKLSTFILTERQFDVESPMLFPSFRVFVVLSLLLFCTVGCKSLGPCAGKSGDKCYIEPREPEGFAPLWKNMPSKGDFEDLAQGEQIEILAIDETKCSDPGKKMVQVKHKAGVGYLCLSQQPHGGYCKKPGKKCPVEQLSARVWQKPDFENQTLRLKADQEVEILSDELMPLPKGIEGRSALKVSARLVKGSAGKPIIGYVQTHVLRNMPKEKTAPKPVSPIVSYTAEQPRYDKAACVEESKAKFKTCYEDCLANPPYNSGVNMSMHQYCELERCEKYRAPCPP